MQTRKKLKFKGRIVIRNSRFIAAFGVFFFSGVTLFVAAARPQVPGKQDQAVRVPENTPDQPLDKEHLAEMKSALQKKQLADDTEKLFQLANELKADMDKTTKDTLSLAVVKKAEQVEKLAHKVREEMKASLGN